MKRDVDQAAIAKRFAVEGDIIELIPFGEGHINDTYRVQIQTESGAIQKYTLQRLNRTVFPKPREVLENFKAVTEFLKQRIAEEGGDAARETLTLIPAQGGGLSVLDEDGEMWRMYRYIDHCSTRQISDSPESFAAAGEGFARFLRRLDRFPADGLHEVIPRFHDTQDRFRKLRRAMEENRSGRLEQALPELEQALSWENQASYLMDRLHAGVLPLRVTHNDTKINNILFDEETNRALCVIDLDTIMPGLVAYDFGDANRAGAATAREDEPNLELVHFDEAYYEAYAKAYLAETGEILTEEEVRSLPMGCFLMTLECGVRFLTDFLDGDVYFKCAYPEHNLVRARTQLRMAAEIESKLAHMTQTVLACYAENRARRENGDRA